MVKIYLCPDKCSSGRPSNYSLLADILLDSVPVYTAVNHPLPITAPHKTGPVFKSEGRGQLEIRPLGARMFSPVWLRLGGVEGVWGRSLFHHLTLVPFRMRGTARPPPAVFTAARKLAAEIFPLVFSQQTGWEVSLVRHPKRDDGVRFAVIKCHDCKITKARVSVGGVIVLGGLLCCKWIYQSFLCIGARRRLSEASP